MADTMKEFGPTSSGGIVSWLGERRAGQQAHLLPPTAVQAQISPRMKALILLLVYLTLKETT